MSLLDAHEEDLAQSFDKVPLAAPKPKEAKFSTWATLKAAPRGVIGGAGEAMGSTADVLGGFGSVLGATEAGGAGMFGGQSEREKADAKKARASMLQQGPDYMSEGGRSLRNASKEYLPDPETAHIAENLVGNAFRLLSKGVTSSVLMGNVAGAVLTGVEEGFTTSDSLALKNVDAVTRTKAGAVAAVATAAGFAIPVAGKTLMQTAGLVLASGPATFMAQQAATSKILANANYAELSKEYDPTDPFGLGLSLAVPGMFAAGVHGLRFKAQKANQAKPTPNSPTPQTEAVATPSVSHETVDAAMTHNLTLLRDAQILREQEIQQNQVTAQSNTAPAAIKDVANVITERGMQVQTRYKLVEADTLVTSHGNDLTANPAFPAELQPRDRARAASADQIARIENQIRPELLGESVKASDGAPIVGPDAVVESGNARTIALRRAYESGKADEYRAWLSGNAERFGATAEDVAGMKRPVLVRERMGSVDRAEFTRQANESPVAALSPTEQARADAARTKDLGGLVPNEDGSVNMAQSAGWVRSFMQGVPPTERGAMMQADGQLSQAGAQRIRNAVFAKAYGDPAILSALSESTNSNIKNILAGLLRAAPEVAKLQDLIASGARQPMDFAPDLVRAVRELSDLRARGVSVEQHLTQSSMFDGGLPAELNNLLVGLSENARSPKRISEMIKSMVQAVDNLGDPRQASLLSDAPPTRGDMTANAVERMRTLTDAQLTDTPPETFKTSTDPLMRSIADRVAVAEATHGDLQVGTTADGQPITIAQALEQVRREALDGTDTELGHNEAHLVQAAADCFLSTGV
jgi:ddrB-like ParB superfamily domain